MKPIKMESPRVGESYYQYKHPSGVTLLLCPMKGFRTTYALFGTNYGSVDTAFKTAGEDSFVTVPEGIAHFLEHKLFESEDQDAFERYAKTGASANAYTSFDKTCYLFSCSNNFEASLEILLDFVTSPYFTAETVQKEQGIIGQEIKMYEDDPDWRVFFNLLGALYQENPVRIDIAGTIESISKIDKDLLYRCYHTFYNLHNMAISIAGNFDIEKVLQLVDKYCKPSEDPKIERKIPKEPMEVRQRIVRQTLPVAVPLFQIGYKLPWNEEDLKENIQNQILDEILLEIIAGETTPLYRRLYDEGLINATFGGEAHISRGSMAAIFAGESRDPEKVYEAVCAEVDRLREGIPEDLFIRCKKSAYGRYISMFNNVEAVASSMLLCEFYQTGLFDLVEQVAGVTLGQVQQRLDSCYLNERSAVSIVAGPASAD